MSTRIYAEPLASTRERMAPFRAQAAAFGRIPGFNVSLRPIIAVLERGFDVVCGSRYVPGGGYRNFPLKRWIFSVGANLTMQWYCGLRPVKDYTLFYRGYRAAL